jgi:hypothetical protein
MTSLDESPAHRLGLADVLEQLGEELREASGRGGATLAWMNASVEMEVAIEASASGGVKFWVLNAEAAAGLTRTTRITINLNPHPDFDQVKGVGK